MTRYNHIALTEAAAALFATAGLAEPIARAVAEILVEADLLGYDTHGLQFIPGYLNEIESGRMTRDGEPETYRDAAGALALDARGLPGQWAVVRALDMALERIVDNPVVSVSIRGSGNISCLATYAKRAADAGFLALLATSGTGHAAVAPHGGRAARLSTNPIAFAAPTADGLILIDISTASTTNRMVERTRRAGEKFPQPWLLDAEGTPSNDPEVFGGDPRGAIMPLGGTELGHKGFAFAIMVEALALGLAGRGRHRPLEAGNCNVYLQLMDPEAFGGGAAFRDELGAFAAACRDTPPRPGFSAVRMPGDRAMACYAEQTARGVVLHPDVIARMIPCFEKYGVAPPEPMR